MTATSLHTFLTDLHRAHCVIDLSAVTFVEPAALVSIVALADRARSDGRFVDFRGPAGTGTCSGYLHRMGLETMLGSLGVPSDLNRVRWRPHGDRLMELRQFTASGAEWDDLADQIFFIVSQRLGKDVAVALYESVVELGANITEHSHAGRGYVALQSYGDGAVNFAVADPGIGLRRSLEVANEVESDEHAVVLAARPGVSGTGQPGRGQGIASVIRRTEIARGYVTLISGRASGTTSPGAPEEQKLQVRACVSEFPGTVVAVRLFT